MIVCTKCGLQNDPSDSFCGSCGSFLEWTGTRIDEPVAVPEPPAAPEPSSAPEQPGLIVRVREAVGLGGHAAVPPADAEAAEVALRDAEAAMAATAATATPAVPVPVVVSGPKVFRIVDETPEPAPAPPASAPALVSEPEPAPPESAPVEPAPPPPPEPAPPESAPVSEPEPAPVPAAEPPRAPEAMIRAPEPAESATTTPAVPVVPLPFSVEAVPTTDHLSVERAPDASDGMPAGEGAPPGEPGPAPSAPSHEGLPERQDPGSGEVVVETPLPAIAPEREPEPATTPAPAPAREPEAPPVGATCVGCGRANAPGRVFCASCGERLPTGAPAPGSLTGAPAPGSPTGAPAAPPPPERAEPRIRPMLPGAAAAPTPKALVQPSRAPEPAPPLATSPADRSPATRPAAPPLAEPAQAPAGRAGSAQPPARLPGVPAAVAATAVGAATPPVGGPTAAPVAPHTPAPSAPRDHPPAPADQPAARRPEAVKPGAERSRPSPRPASEATPAPNPGDLVCGNCGIGNDPARKFCRRCGQSLATAIVAPRAPWYRRIFGPRPKAKVAAGERPKSMRTDGRTGDGIKTGRLLSAGVQVVLLAGVIGIVTGYALVPSWRDAVGGFVGSVKEMILPSADQVYTSGPTSGPGTKEHPARLAFDRTLAFWAAPFADGSPPAIEGLFTPPATVAKILVTAGAAGDEYKAFARPRDVTFEFLDASDTVIASRSYELKDRADPQPFDVGAKGASRIRLTVRSVFPAEEPRAPVAITEVEFFGSQEGSTPKPAP